MLAWQKGVKLCGVEQQMIKSHHSANRVDERKSNTLLGERSYFLHLHKKYLTSFNLESMSSKSKIFHILIVKAILGRMLRSPLRWHIINYQGEASVTSILWVMVVVLVMTMWHLTGCWWLMTAEMLAWSTPLTPGWHCITIRHLSHLVSDWQCHSQCQVYCHLMKH